LSNADIQPLSIKHQKREKILSLQIKDDDLVSLTGILKKLYHSTLVIISCIKADKLFQLRYIWQFSGDKQSQSVLLTTIETEKPIVLSITTIFPSAIMYERELFTQFNIRFINQIKISSIIPHELVKRKLKQPEISIKGSVTNFQHKTSDQYCVINYPYDDQIEKFRFQFLIQDEMIQACSLNLGFSYIPIEDQLRINAWQDNIGLIEKLCGMCSVSHHLAYSITLEKLLCISNEIPDRATWIRTLLAELERVQNHLLWFAFSINTLGLKSTFHDIWKKWQRILEILKRLSGKTLYYSIITIGGISKDIPRDQLISIRTELDHLKNELLNQWEFFAKEVSITKGIGILKNKDALELGSVGPTARASGMEVDARKLTPYIAYSEIPFDVCTLQNGDMFDNLHLKYLEVISSLDMCFYLIDNLPHGEITLPVKGEIPPGEAFTTVEAPFGQLLYQISSNGEQYPAQVKIRTPTIANIPSLLHRLRGNPVKFIPLILRGIEMGIDPLEKIVFIDDYTSELMVKSGEEFRKSTTHAIFTDADLKLFQQS
jgi:Ni,Fe-hydrogenase III large subunit